MTHKRVYMDKAHKEATQKLASFFYDLAKLTFAGMVVGGVMAATSGGAYAKFIVISAIGILITAYLARLGYLFTLKDK